MRTIFCRLWLAVLAAGGLAGCTDEGGELGASSPILLTLGSEGTAGLRAETAFTAEAIQGGLPDTFVLEADRVSLDSTSVPVFYAFFEGLIVLEVYPAANGRTIGRIDAASAKVAGPGGVRPGAGFRQADGDDMACEPGRDELEERAVCTRGGPLRYVFAHGARMAPGELPERDVLRQSILERIVWVAP